MLPEAEWQAGTAVTSILCNFFQQQFLLEFATAGGFFQA